MWMETEKGERFADWRIQEALDIGAECIATACPFCLLMFEDSIKTMEKEGEIRVMDIAELVASSI